MLQKHALIREELQPATINFLDANWQLKLLQESTTPWKFNDGYGAQEHKNQCADQLMMDIVTGVSFNVLNANESPSSDRTLNSEAYLRDNVSFMFAKFNYAKGACPAFYNMECFLHYCETHGLPSYTDPLKLALDIVRKYFANVIGVYKETH